MNGSHYHVQLIIMIYDIKHIYIYKGRGTIWANEEAFYVPLMINKIKYNIHGRTR